MDWITNILNGLSSLVDVIISVINTLAIVVACLFIWGMFVFVTVWAAQVARGF